MHFNILGDDYSFLVMLFAVNDLLSPRRVKTFGKEGALSGEIERRWLEPIHSVSIVQALPLELVIEVGQLLDEALVRIYVTMHSNGPNGLRGRHFTSNH